MADKKGKFREDIWHRLREAVHGTQEFLHLEREDVVSHAEDHLESVEEEINDMERALHETSEATRIAVSEALGDLRGRHAEALRRLRLLQDAVDESIPHAKKTLAEALEELKRSIDE